jgi:hypothetical protein
MEEFMNKLSKHNQLYTVWGENLDKENVLSEYPRPNLKRDSYINLNGLWDYKITKTTNLPIDYDGKILVPFSPECRLSGVERQLKPNEILWYSKKIHVMKAFNIGRIILHFGAVDQYCEVYLNKKLVKSHVGGYLPFSIDITADLLDEENHLMVMVKDFSETSFHARGKQKLERGGMFYTAQSGIWQTVWLESVPLDFISDLKITPLFDESKISIQVKSSKIMEGNILIYDQAHLVATRKMISNKEQKIYIENFKSWSPEKPFLYTLKVKTKHDFVESYFAMRKCAVDKDKKGIMRLLLNNEPYFHNGVLDQGYWPDGLYTAPSDQALSYDILKMKELGFNMLRKHSKIEPLRWYYHCDRIGMLVWQDLVNGGEKYNTPLVCYLPNLLPWFINHIKDNHYKLFSRNNKDGRDEFINELENTVELLYNYPSVVMWVPFNEGWGQFDSEKMLSIIEKTDKTRTIDHASGWFDQGVSQVKSIHIYFKRIRIKRDKRAIVLSEFGGYSCVIRNHSYGLKAFGYRRYKNLEKLTKGYQELYRNQVIPMVKIGLSAAVYTQVSDVEDEVNGILTYDRKVLKLNETVVKNLNKLLLKSYTK